MNKEEIACLLALIKKSEFDEVELSVGDLRLHVRKKGSPSTAASSPSRVALPAETAANQRSVERPKRKSGAQVQILAPMLGTFFRAPSPGAPPFVEVGSRVTPDQSVGLIEVMKLFSPVTAGVFGVVAEFRVADSELVEYDQPLLVIDVESEAEK